MEPISLNNYLTNKNPWTSRLLGLSEFHKKRDIQQIENEYNLDKYAKLVESNFATHEEFKTLEFEQAGLSANSEVIVSFQESLFSTSVANARNMYYALIRSKLDKYKSPNYCELGCGYGFNLTLCNGKVSGGEYSKNAVNIAQKLGYDVREFNYYTPADYEFIKPDTTVFTIHSIEQIPDATLIIESLAKQKSKINYIVHFEPTVVEERNTLFGLMRNKYMEMNDYNRNLIRVLKERDDVEILEFEKDIFGLMPLNTANLIVWKFK